MSWNAHLARACELRDAVEHSSHQVPHLRGAILNDADGQSGVLLQRAFQICLDAFNDSIRSVMRRSCVATSYERLTILVGDAKGGHVPHAVPHHDLRLHLFDGLYRGSYPFDEF